MVSAARLVGGVATLLLVLMAAEPLHGTQLRGRGGRQADGGAGTGTTTPSTTTTAAPVTAATTTATSAATTALTTAATTTAATTTAATTTAATTTAATTTAATTTAATTSAATTTAATTSAATTTAATTTAATTTAATTTAATTATTSTLASTASPASTPGAADYWGLLGLLHARPQHAAHGPLGAHAGAGKWGHLVRPAMHAHQQQQQQQQQHVLLAPVKWTHVATFLAADSPPSTTTTTTTTTTTPRPPPPLQDPVNVLFVPASQHFVQQHPRPLADRLHGKRPQQEALLVVPGLAGAAPLAKPASRPMAVALVTLKKPSTGLNKGHHHHLKDVLHRSVPSSAAEDSAERVVEPLGFTSPERYGMVGHGGATQHWGPCSHRSTQHQPQHQQHRLESHQEYQHLQQHDQHQQWATAPLSSMQQQHHHLQQQQWAPAPLSPLLQRHDQQQHQQHQQWAPAPLSPLQQWAQDTLSAILQDQWLRYPAVK